MVAVFVSPGELIVIVNRCCHSQDKNFSQGQNRWIILCI